MNKVGKTKSVKIVETDNQNIIDNHNEVQVGLDKVSGTIPKTVHIDVNNTGSNLDIQASAIASLNSIFSLKFKFILSKRIIQFLTTIQNNATNQINPGKLKGCPNNVNPKNTQISDNGIVTITKTDCL